MPYPKYFEITNPILQELNAVGGTENVRFLYEKLLPYFPQLTEDEIFQIKNGISKKWRAVVQEAAKSLDSEGLIVRSQGIWSITEKGKTAAAAENEDFEPARNEQKELNHREIQAMLIEIGESLNYSAEMEFEFYDVVWRISPNSPRLSHVFEVQSKGNIDSAFAKLKRAHEAQRSKPFLILSSERDLRRALREISYERSGAFHELSEVITILSFEQIRKTHQSLTSISEILAKFLAK
jgi:hypothetical protein